MRRLLLFLPLLLACSEEGAPARPSNSAPPQRLVSFTPSLTEIVFALGAGDRVLGTTDWCRHPPEAKAKEKLGGLFNPNYERIVELRPDLFLVSAALKDIADRVERAGIRTLRVPCETLEDVDSGIEIVGQAIGKESEARALRDSIRERLAKIEARLAGASPTSVLVVLERTPGAVQGLSAVGPGNVIDSSIRLAGGKNALGDSALPYPKISAEEILARNPERIVDFSVHGYAAQGDDAREREAWKKLGSVRAVREGKVFLMPEGFDLYPGPRVPEIVEAFAKILHPERFP